MESHKVWYNYFYSMTTLTHIAVGAVIAKAALSKHNIHADPLITYAVAILFSNLPDMDIPLYGLRRAVRLNWNHRIHSFLHFPLFWVAGMILFQFLAPATIRQTVHPYETIALVSLGVHFLMDTFGLHRGICWFGPFLKKQLSFTRLVSEPGLFRSSIALYSRSVIFKAEMILCVACIFFLLMRS